MFIFLVIFFCFFYVKLFVIPAQYCVCVLCADVMYSHVLYVCARAVRITAECGYVVNLCFCFLFIV